MHARSEHVQVQTLLHGRMARVRNTMILFYVFRVFWTVTPSDRSTRRIGRCMCGNSQVALSNCMQQCFTSAETLSNVFELHR